MIIAIEGPDGSGKSTVVTHLDRLFRGAQVIQFRSTPREYIDCIQVLEPFVFSLFEQMYDPAKVYICDRFFSVSSRVYARMRNEVSEFERLALDAWALPELHVIYLDQRVEVMLSRLAQRDRPYDGGAYARQLRECYKAILKEINPASQHVIDTESGISKTVHQAIRIVERIIEQHVRREEN